MLKVYAENAWGVPNQFIIEADNYWYFQSYQTVIARKGDGRVLLAPQWDCSRTTMKYLHQFLGTASKKEIEAGIKSGRYIIENLN
jgi:hypothetical protein